MKNSNCPWCGHKINRFKDQQGVRKRKTPLHLRFAQCSHCFHYYGQNTKSKRNVIAFIAIVLSLILSICFQNAYMLLLIFFFLGIVVTSPLERMTPDENIFEDVKNYKWNINTDSLSKRLSYYKEAPNGFFDEDLVITEDNKYGIFFYNICEVRMCSYQSAVAIFSSNNLNEPLVDLKPISPYLAGSIYGYKRYFYAPFSDCIITVCNINKEYPFLLIKPSEKMFAFIPFDYTSIYYSLKETEKNKIILEDEFLSELKHLEEKGYVKQTGKQFSLSALNWYDITEFENIEKIYLDIKDD